jgi:hypothetical protein
MKLKGGLSMKKKESEKISIPNATIDQIFEVIRALSISPKSQEEIKRFLNLKHPPAHAVRALVELGFAIREGGKYKLLDEYIEIPKMGKENKKVKEIFEDKFIEYKPFKALIKIIETCGGRIKKDEVGDYLEGELRAKWSKTTKNQYVNVLLNWGIYADIIFHKDSEIFLNPKYLVSPIISVQIRDHSKIFDKYLYDFFQELDLSKMLEEIEKLEGQIATSKKRGEIFEEIIERSFRVLGFSVRRKTGERERSAALTYESREGGGDMGLFIHVPVKIGAEIFDGIAIAAEVKATDKGAPKKSIDQVRTFSTKIKELFPNYYILKVVVSQSIGFEPYHARKKASPDVVHTPYEVIKYLVKSQFKRFSENNDLITPFEVIEILRNAMREGQLELTEEYVKKFI